MSLRLAIPFSGGVMLAASVSPADPLPSVRRPAGSLIMKTPWGLVALSPGEVGQGDLREALSRPADQGIASLLRLAGRAASAAPAWPWLLSYEPDPRSPVAGPAGASGLSPTLFRFDGRRLERVFWGVFLAPPEFERHPLDDARRLLQGLLAGGEDFEHRFLAVMEVFACAGGAASALGSELDLGIHEPDHRYSVDRFDWRPFVEPLLEPPDR